MHMKVSQTLIRFGLGMRGNHFYSERYLAAKDRQLAELDACRIMTPPKQSPHPKRGKR